VFSAFFSWASISAPDPRAVDRALYTTADEWDTGLSPLQRPCTAAYRSCLKGALLSYYRAEMRCRNLHGEPGMSESWGCWVARALFEASMLAAWGGAIMATKHLGGKYAGAVLRITRSPRWVARGANAWNLGVRIWGWSTFGSFVLGDVVQDACILHYSERRHAKLNKCVRGAWEDWGKDWWECQFYKIDCQIRAHCKDRRAGASGVQE